MGLFILMLGCNPSNPTTDSGDFEHLVSNVKQRYAPDKRVKLFAIEGIENPDKTLVLQGKTTEKAALEALLDSLKSKGIPFDDQVRILPDTAVGKLQYAVGRNSVLNIRSKPKHSAELGTQGLLGTPLRVLDKQGDFYQVQTPDQYISWVDKGGITRMDETSFTQWEKQTKVLYTQITGWVYQSTAAKQAVSDIVFGGQLVYLDENEGFYKVKYPDERVGYLRKSESVLYAEWQAQLTASPGNMLAAGNGLMGVPYLWGGTSTKGMDCSGFTKTVYLMNGFIIPRDASQQVLVGDAIDENLRFEGLEVGDLLFFGKKATADSKQKVTHVAMWIGNKRFIHASGNIHISSIDPNDTLYDEFNVNRYLGSKRYLNSNDPGIIDLKKPRKIKG
jgi:cell wall-associated NlpC family hydrolase